MNQYRIGDIVLRRGVNFAAYITNKYWSSEKARYQYDIYYWKYNKIFTKFNDSELELLTMENVYKCQ